MTDKRDSIRMPFKTRIRLSGDGDGLLEAYTKDLSDSGVFISVEPEQAPDVGVCLQGQVLDLPGGEGPVVDMEVVRVAPDGIGLKFLR